MCWKSARIGKEKGSSSTKPLPIKKRNHCRMQSYEIGLPRNPGLYYSIPRIIASSAPIYTTSIFSLLLQPIMSLTSSSIFRTHHSKNPSPSPHPASISDCERNKTISPKPCNSVAMLSRPSTEVPFAIIQSQLIYIATIS